MKVAQLISLLQAEDRDADVVCDDHAGGSYEAVGVSYWEDHNDEEIKKQITIETSIHSRVKIPKDE